MAADANGVPHRRGLIAAALAGGATTAAARPDALVLARRYVEQHRGTLPDLPLLILGRAAIDTPPGTAEQALVDAVRTEAAAAEPGFREATARILARNLTERELLGALAKGSLDDVLNCGPERDALAGQLQELVMDTCAAIARRAERRSGPR